MIGVLRHGKISHIRHRKQRPSDGYSNHKDKRYPTRKKHLKQHETANAAQQLMKHRQRRARQLNNL